MLKYMALAVLLVHPSPPASEPGIAPAVQGDSLQCIGGCVPTVYNCNCGNVPCSAQGYIDPTPGFPCGTGCTLHWHINIFCTGANCNSPQTSGDAVLDCDDNVDVSKRCPGDSSSVYVKLHLTCSACM